MKKFLSLFAAVLFAGSMMAEPIILDYSAKGYANQQDLDGVAVTEGVISITLAKGSGSNGPKYYTTGTGARTYGGNTMTIACSEGLITTIVFDFTQNDKDYTVDAGVYSKADAMWTGSAETILFTTEAGSGHNRIRSVAIYLNGEEPVIDTWVADTISVAAANALIAQKDKHDHYVVGVLMGAPFNVYDPFKGTVSFWLSDVENPTDSIEFFQGGAENNGQWASLMEAQETLHKGDTVMVYAGALMTYGKAANDTITEITGGYYAEMIGANSNPPVVEYEELTVAEAIAIAEALNPDKGKSKSTTQIYAVYGYVVGISGTKTNTFYLADEAGAYGEFQAYQCAEIDAAVAEGDYVVVTGPITHYFGYDKENPDDESKYYHNYEISGGKLEHAVAPEGIENVVLTEKAQKVVVDGVLYIIRDNKMFNVQGTQVR